MAIAEIHVTLKPALLDTQGTTVAKALHQLGYETVRNVRIGKFITVEVADGVDSDRLQIQLEEMCQKLLANPVIEDYEIAFDETQIRETAPNIADVEPLTQAPARVVAPNGAIVGHSELRSAHVVPAPTASSQEAIPTVPASALTPNEQLANAKISRSEAATPEPFAMDYERFQTLSPADKLALQELAWRKHGTWIRQQLDAQSAQWILCAGENVVASGTTLDTFPDDTKRAQVARSSGLVPWVFVRPPQA